MFPFIISFKKKLGADFDPVPDEVILDCFRRYLEHNIDARINSDGKLLKFRNISLFSFKVFKIWDGITGGAFEIREKGKNRTAVYSFNVALLFVIMLFFGIFSGFVSGEILFGLIAIAFFCFVGFGIVMIAHWSNFRAFMKDVKRVVRKQHLV